MVIVDTSIWVQFFKKNNSKERRELDLLLVQNEVLMVGVVLAEVLQGARNQHEFERLRDHLSTLPYAQETRDTWTLIGALSYQLRQNGATLSLIDLLIAALAIQRKCEVYTLDQHFARVPGLTLHKVPEPKIGS